MTSVDPDRAGVGLATPPVDSLLRWMVDSYEQAQRIRLAAGERIRAVLQGRDSAEPGRESPASDPDPVLDAIRRGLAEGPVPVLGRTYHRHWVEEQELAAELRSRIEEHPAWPWLRAVRGAGPLLAARLLSQLDVHRAETPSAFWAFCGLATVPGVEYRCATCGLENTFPTHFRVSGSHKSLQSGRRCPGRLVPVRGPDDGARAAQPRPAAGQRSPYSRRAKTVCYLLGVSFLRTRGAYASLYRRERERLDRSRPSWPPKRRHLAALRKTEKLFLSHLWLVWREALGLPTVPPYAHAVLDRVEWVDPWQMAEGGAAPSGR